MPCKMGKKVWIAQNNISNMDDPVGAGVDNRWLLLGRILANFSRRRTPDRKMSALKAKNIGGVMGKTNDF